MSADFNTNGEGKEEWLTPLEIIEALGPFDLDPCFLPPSERPWNTATEMFWLESPMCNGLTKEWSGRVWCNPPYGRKLGPFLDRLSQHGNGIALVFARTETKAFHQFVWPRADAIVFPKGRIKFRDQTGKIPLVWSKSAGKWQESSPNAASCFIAYGENNVERLQKYANATEAAFLRIERKSPK